MGVRLNLWKSQNGFVRVYVNGLPSGKAWLQTNKGRTVVQFETDAVGMSAEEVISLAREVAGVDPHDWVAFLDAVQSAPVPRGRAPGKMAANRRNYDALPPEWTAEHALGLDPDIKTHPLTQPVTILVDDREPAEMVDRLRTVRNLSVQIGSWETGDYIVPDKLIVERKTAADFANSIIEKRLFPQTERIASSGLRGIFLIEGNVYQQTNMSLVSITGALSYLSAIQGLSVISTLSLEHTAHMIVKLTRHAVEGLGYEIPLRGAGPKDPAGAAAFVIEGIPGISTALSKQLLAAFGSIAGLARAEYEDLIALPGIGPSKARMIFETLRAGPISAQPGCGN